MRTVLEISKKDGEQVLGEQRRFYLFITIWGIPQQGIGLPWSRGSPNNVDDMHEQVMPVLVNVSECKREAWCWECEREGSMGVAVKRIDTETMTR